jgi:hypothetical protein
MVSKRACRGSGDANVVKDESGRNDVADGCPLRTQRSLFPAPGLLDTQSAVVAIEGVTLVRKPSAEHAAVFEGRADEITDGGRGAARGSKGTPPNTGSDAFAREKDTIGCQEAG